MQETDILTREWIYSCQDGSLQKTCNPGFTDLQLKIKNMKERWLFAEAMRADVLLQIYTGFLLNVSLNHHN